MPPVICNQLPQNMVVMSMTHMKIVNFQCTWTSWSSFMSLTQMKIVNFQYSWTSWSSDSSVVAFSQFHVCIKSVLTSLGYHSVIIMYWDNESFQHAIIKVRHEQQGLLVGLATQVNKHKKLQPQTWSFNEWKTLMPKHAANQTNSTSESSSKTFSVPSSTG